MELAGNFPSIGLIEVSQSWSGGIKTRHIFVPKEKLEARLQRCRSNNMIIAAAVHAVLAVVTQKYKSNIAKKFTNVTFFDY